MAWFGSATDRAALLACMLLAACASNSHVTAVQEAPLTPSPRAMTLALQSGETLPFGITSQRILEAAARAGYEMRDDHAHYRLSLTAALGAARSGSYLPGPQSNAPQSWIARPDHSLRTRFAGGRILRVNAVLIDLQNNREVWRGTGTLRTADANGNAPELVDEVLAKLPRG